MAEGVVSRHGGLRGAIEGIRERVRDLDLPLVARASKSIEKPKKVTRDWQREERIERGKAQDARNARVTKMYIELASRTDLTEDEKVEMDALYWDLRVQSPLYPKFEELMKELSAEVKSNSETWADIYGVLSGSKFAMARDERLTFNKSYKKMMGDMWAEAAKVCKSQGPMAEIAYIVDVLQSSRYENGPLEYLKFKNSATRGKYFATLMTAKEKHREFDEFCTQIRGINGVKVLNKYQYEPKKLSEGQIVPIPICWSGRKMKEAMYYLAVEPDSEFWQMYKVGSKEANLPFVVDSELTEKGKKQYRHQTERYYRGDRADAMRRKMATLHAEAKKAEQHMEEAQEEIPGDWITFEKREGKPLKDNSGKPVRPIFIPEDSNGESAL